MKSTEDLEPLTAREIEHDKKLYGDICAEAQRETMAWLRAIRILRYIAALEQARLELAEMEWKPRSTLARQATMGRSRAMGDAKRKAATLALAGGRHPDEIDGPDMAAARDFWLVSDQGSRSMAGAASGQFLKNRLEHAFLAGYEEGHRKGVKRALAWVKRQVGA